MAFVLPPMRPGKNKKGVLYNQVTPLGSKGTWQSVSFESLDKVADSLDVAQEGGGIVSIPDVWAHCRFFEQALTEDGHPSQEQAVRQWRGLLALIALQPNLFYRLSTASIDLSGNGLGLFLKVLERTKPTATLAAGLVWSQIGVLYVSTGQSVSVAGLIIPSTLVCPASTSELPRGMVPWIEDGRLSDPLKSSALSNEQLVALQKYVQKLRAAVQAASKPDLVLQLAIKNRLDEFDKELTTKTKDTAVTFEDVALGIGVTGALYDTLSTGVRIVTESEASDVLLKSRIPKTQKNAILVDTTLASSSEGRVQVKIWDHITLEDYAGGLVTLDQLRQRAKEHVVLTPDDVFEARLVKVAAASFKEHPDDFKEYLLPLKPTVLYYLSPEQLREGLRLRKGKEGEWIVEIDIPLTGRVHTMKRVYTKSDTSSDRIVDAKLPPTMARWPNFVAEDWNYYFLYYGGNPKKTKQFAPQAMFLKGIGVNLPGSADLRLRSHEQEARTELYHATTPPEAVICQLPKDEAGPASATGLLLLPMGDIVGPKASSCTVGIDFGSISTSIYARVNEKSAPVSFQERFLYPYDLQEAGRVEIERQFLPPGTTKIPFQSLTKDRDSSPSAEKSDDTPFWTQFIYYARKWDDTIAQIKTNQLRSNLKWSSDPLDRERVQRFLAQCVLQTAAELVAATNPADRVSLSQITWRVSYPEAFHDLEVDQYGKIAKEAVRLVTNPSAQKALEVVKRPESLAAALYFVNRKDVAGAGTFSDPAVSIDVGGSTSDISVWQTNEELWRTSLRLGGRDLIQAYLKQHPNLFAEIAPTATNLKSVAVELGKLRDDPSRDQAVACLIESEIFNEQISKRYGIVAAHPLIIQMVHVVEFAISGLLYYVAMALKRLVNSAQLKQGTQLTLCFAGRGSLLFTDTLDSGRGNALKRLVVETSTLGSIDKVRIVKSADPKHEVAFGLVQDAAILASGVKGEGILGEIVRVDGTELGADAPASKLEEALDLDYEVGPLSNLADFFSKYRRHFGRTFACEASDVVAEVQGTLTAERNALRARKSETGGKQTADTHGGKLMNIEPPFIVGLRALIAKIIKEDIRIGP